MQHFTSIAEYQKRLVSGFLYTFGVRKMQQNSHSVAGDAWPPRQMELDARLRDSEVSPREIAVLLGVSLGTVAACSKRLPRHASVVA